MSCDVASSNFPFFYVFHFKDNNIHPRLIAGASVGRRGDEGRIFSGHRWCFHFVCLIQIGAGEEFKYFAM
jgi:hypothetical protein